MTWVGELYDLLMSTIIFTLVTNKICIGALKMIKTNGYGHNLNVLIISHPLCFSYPTTSGCGDIQITHIYLNFAKWPSSIIVEFGNTLDISKASAYQSFKVHFVCCEQHDKGFEVSFVIPLATLYDRHTYSHPIENLLRTGYMGHLSENIIHLNIMSAPPQLYMDIYIYIISNGLMVGFSIVSKLG